MKQEGRLKFFDENKGYGIIVEDFTREEVFVHGSEIKSRKIKENSKVQFEKEQGMRGFKAINVKII